MDGIVTLIVQGREWKLSECSPALRKEFAAWCKARARAGLFDDKAGMGQSMFDESLEALNEAIGVGSYTWGPPGKRPRIGRAIHRMMKEQEGQIKLLQILLREAHGDVADDMVLDLMEADVDAVTDAMQRALGMVPNVATPEVKPGEKTEEKTMPATTATPA